MSELFREEELTSPREKSFLGGVAGLALVALVSGFGEAALGTIDVEAAERELISRVKTYPLGEDFVTVKVHENGPGLTFFNMHDNEETAVDAGLKVVADTGGRLIELQHSGDRNITFHMNGVTYIIDPNRMFTEVGIEKSLRALGGTYSEEARDAVGHFVRDMFADFDLNMAGGGTLIALHNNYESSGGETKFSIKNYSPGGETKDVYNSSSRTDIDDFYYVTEASDFQTLKSMDFSVVLQDKVGVVDNGSLSVYCSQNGIPYINIEAQHGHEDAQVEMLRALSYLNGYLALPISQ